MKTRDILIIGGLGLGAIYLLGKYGSRPGKASIVPLGTEKIEPFKEPRGTVSPTAYRGTDIQQSPIGVVTRAAGFGPGWLGIPPSGAAGMRYYSQTR